MDGKLTETHRFDDIINLPHHVSATRPRMSGLDRAAQFSPFAALSGFEAALFEAARLTEERAELDGDEMELLDWELRLLRDRIGEGPEVRVVYFVADGWKEGGAYEAAAGRLKRIDGFSRRIVFENGLEVPIGDIVEIDGTGI